jgi:ABC-type Fe3+ transport system substrate-binding protein
MTNLIKALFTLTLLVTLFAPKSLLAEELVIISPHWDGLRQEVKSGFYTWLSKQNTPLPAIRFLDVGGGSDIIKYVKSQFDERPKGIGIDLIWGGGTDPFLALESSAHLQPTSLAPGIFDRIPAEILGTPLHGKNNTWHAVSLSAFGILYNKILVDRLKLPIPLSWEVLGDPKVYSWVSSADPRKSASAHVVFDLILQAYGWQRGWQLLNSMALLQLKPHKTLA